MQSKEIKRKNLLDIREQYIARDYRLAAESAERLLILLLVEKYQFIRDNLPEQDNRQITDMIYKEYPGLENKAITHCNLEELAQIYSVTGYLSHNVNDVHALTLLQSFHLMKIVDIIKFCKSTLSSDRDEKLVRISLQQVIQLINILLYEAGVIKLEEEDFLDGIQHSSINLNFKDLREKGFEERFFLIHSERGLLLNVDRKRNIAFKVETFLNLLTKIFRETREQLLLLITDHNKNDPNSIARNIIFEAGKDSGLRFGHSMQEMFQNEGEVLELREKVEKWCEFDSDVGFGRFRNEVQINNSTTNGDSSYIGGSIILAENFLTYNKNTEDDDNICSFMRGYIQGVLEELVGIPLSVSHTKGDCSQYRIDLKGTAECNFHISIDEKRFELKIEHQKSIDMTMEL